MKETEMKETELSRDTETRERGRGLRHIETNIGDREEIQRTGKEGQRDPYTYKGALIQRDKRETFFSLILGKKKPTLVIFFAFSPCPPG